MHFTKARGSGISNDKESHSLSEGICVVVQETFCNTCKGVVVVDVTMFIKRCLREGNVGKDYIHVPQDNGQRQTCERGNEHLFSINP